MKILIEHPKAAQVAFEEDFFPTNEEIDVPFTVGIRLSQKFSVKMIEHEQVPYNPNHWNKDKRFGFYGLVDDTSGWGNVSRNLIKQSLFKGYDVRWIGNNGSEDEIFLTLLGKAIPEDMAMIWHTQPKTIWNASPFKKNIAILPFETTKIPDSWVLKLNRFDAVFVPCKQNMEMMVDSGVRVPVELLHWGVNQEMFYPLKRDNEIFTFGHMGALSNRKGTDLLIEAFAAAFPRSQKDVRLLCKTSFNHFTFASLDERVQIDFLARPHQELLDTFFAKTDCFVFPTRGEGFGLTPLEAMATGIPAIVTGWSGPLEYMRDEFGWLIDYKMVKATSFDKVVYREDCGFWAEPDFDDLVFKMRYAYANQDEVKKKGRMAAQYVKNNWLWKHKITMFHEALDKYL